jgi:putative membrane protein
VNKTPVSHIALLLGVIIVFTWSGWQPYDHLTWWLEIFPGLAGLIILLSIYRRFRFTTLCYTLIAIHICILCVGGHYTYAREPLFDWLRDLFGWHRNHFDRLGHFAQGFVPAIIARELFVRLQILNRERWMPFLIVCICLAISAVYELIEWCTALISASASAAFLGTQGDVWDTQEDILMALIGAVCALVFMSRLHDRQISALPGKQATAP